MIEPVRKFFMRVCMEPRLFPGVRCSVLNTEYRLPSCWITMPGRNCVALMLLIGLTRSRARRVRRLLFAFVMFGNSGQVLRGMTCLPQLDCLRQGRFEARREKN